MNAVEGFKVNDLVWGKMKSFPPWPGMIVEPPEDLVAKRTGTNSHCVYFFGSYNYSWLEEKFIKYYDEFKETYSTICKQSSFLEAVKEMEDYIESGKTGIPAIPEKPKRKTSTVNGNCSTISHTESSGYKDFLKKRKATSKPFTSSESFEKYPKRPRMSLIDRPPRYDPEIAMTDVTKISQNLKDKNIIPTSMTIGFLGLGIMGSRVAKNILLSGHKLMVWNRTPSKCEQFNLAGAEVGPTPADVVQRSDITFSCVSDPQAAKELVFGNCGVLSEMNSDKGFIELTSIDADTSKDIADSIHEKGGRYLEAQMLGSLSEAEDGRLILLCAGDDTLFQDCQTCFRSCSERTPYFLGPTGSAANMNLVFEAMQGIMIASLAEGVSLLQRMNLPLDIFLMAFKLSSVHCQLFSEKIKMILDGKFPTSLPLQHHQKDLRLALSLGQQVSQAMPLTAAVNELYKHARRLGFGGHDTSSIYVRSNY